MPEINMFIFYKEGQKTLHINFIEHTIIWSKLIQLALRANEEKVLNRIHLPCKPMFLFNG